MVMLDYPEMPTFLVRQQEEPRTPMLTLTYTIINTYDNCPHQMYRRYIKKDIKFIETPEMKWGNDVHSAFEYRMGGKPLPANMRHWEPIVSVYAERKAIPEMKLGITKQGKPTGFFDSDVFLRGKADAVIRNGQVVFLGDWKTGNSKYENPFELEIQGLMVKAQMPNLRKIAGQYIWLKENRIGQVYDLSDVASTWARINNKAEQIADSTASGEWPKKKGPLCGYCNVMDCENRFDASMK